MLKQLWLLDEVPGWTPQQNAVSRLVAAPKHHLADPALAARLLHATEGNLLKGNWAGPAFTPEGTLLGGLFESLVTLSVRVYAHAMDAMRSTSS